MSGGKETGRLPAEVTRWMGEVRYETEGDFDADRGHIQTSCASVDHGQGGL